VSGGRLGRSRHVFLGPLKMLKAPAVAEALGSLGAVEVGRVLIADFTQLADCLEAFVVFLLTLHQGGYSFAALLSEEPGGLGTVDDFLMSHVRPLHVCGLSLAALGRFIRQNAMRRIISVTTLERVVVVDADRAAKGPEGPLAWIGIDQEAAVSPSGRFGFCLGLL
jgi:hypothetical protein